MCILKKAASSIEMDKRVLNKDRGFKPVFEGTAMEFLTFTEGHEFGAGFKEERVGVGVGRGGGGEHAAVDGEGGGGVEGLGEAADDGVEGEDVGGVDLGEDGEGIGHGGDGREEGDESEDEVFGEMRVRDRDAGAEGVRVDALDGGEGRE